MDHSTLNAMKHSPIRNYIIPGLTSWLISTPTKEHGCVRLFENDRQPFHTIEPHSHRFDFSCQVLEGTVTNRVWRPAVQSEQPHADEFMIKFMQYKGEVGEYKTTIGGVNRWVSTETTYGAGQWYHMVSDQIHSIQFSKGAKVLFFEGPENNDITMLLQPWVDRELVNTFKVEDWMFKRNS